MLCLIDVYSQTIEGVTFVVALNKDQILTTSFHKDEKSAIHTVLNNLPFSVPFQVFSISPSSANKAISTMKLIYDGENPVIDLPLCTSHLSAYTKKVLKATVAIPIGYVSTYGAIAMAVGGGPRAVGNAMACNLFAPIVPCHRVVKSNLTLGGYSAGGLKVKLDFLTRERRGYSEPRCIMVCGGQLKVFPVELVLAKFT